ncbi:MAG TPA: hypothetical protein VIQ24_09655 [Pyrinomonadaceae bacterium]
MVRERDKRVLGTSIYLVAGFLAFFAINSLLDGRVPEVIRLGLGVWAMQISIYPLTKEEYGAGGFGGWIGQTALYVVVGMIIYSLIKYLWQLL